MASVDLNADLGESFGAWRLGDDDAMLGLVTSANVACGFHAGDPATLSHSCAAAARQGVRIGAQVGYRDLAGFGRRFIDVTPDDLRADVIYQIGALQALARVAGSSVTYVKPHGALYNTIVTNRDQAARGRGGGARRRPQAAGARAWRVRCSSPRRNASACAPCRRRSPIAPIAPTASWFPDANATPCLHDPAEIADRVASMVQSGRVVAVDGSTIPITVESVCVHGDSPGAVQIATAVRDRLISDGVDLAAFV